MTTKWLTTYLLLLTLLISLWEILSVSFWNFNLGAWDSTGCEVKPYISEGDKTGKITCECNHKTSFSILMSPFSIEQKALAYVTYIGVAVSMASLIICLIIETIVWKSNDKKWHILHATCLHSQHCRVPADHKHLFYHWSCNRRKWAAKLSGSLQSSGFLFMHFLYLALFFWMLLSVLLLFYRTVMVCLKCQGLKWWSLPS